VLVRIVVKHKHKSEVKKELEGAYCVVSKHWQLNIKWMKA